MLIAGNPPQALDSCSLTPELYKTALDVLSKSRVTHQVGPSVSVRPSIEHALCAHQI